MNTSEELGEQLKDADVAKYISALFRAEEAFRKELSEYKHDGDSKKDELESVVKDAITGTLFKQLPLKYRLALKLSWPYVVDSLASFLKELGSGLMEDVLTGFAKIYIDNVAKESNGSSTAK